MSEYYINELIKSLDVAVEKHLRRQLESHPTGFTSSQMQIISYLVNNQDKVVHQMDLETFFNLSRPTINGIIKRLREKDAVFLVADPQDKRAKQLKLSPQILADAARHKADFEHDMDQLERQMFKNFNEAEIKQFRSSLQRALANLQD